MIPPAYLHECFVHQADGTLLWKQRPREHFLSDRSQRSCNAKHAGKPVGRVSKEGYLFVTLTYLGRAHTVYVSRLIWAMHHGEWPKDQIDHINRIPADNRIENLRDVTGLENLANRIVFSGPGRRSPRRRHGSSSLIHA